MTQLTRRDYAIASANGVRTGATLGLGTVTTSEAHLLDRQRDANRYLSQFVSQQGEMARSMSRAEQRGGETVAELRSVDSGVRSGFAKVNAHLRSGFGAVTGAVENLGTRVDVGVEELGRRVDAGSRSVRDAVRGGLDAHAARLEETLHHVGGQIGSDLRHVAAVVATQGEIARKHDLAIAAEHDRVVSTGLANIDDTLNQLDENIAAGLQDVSSAVSHEGELSRHQSRALAIESMRVSDGGFRAVQAVIASQAALSRAQELAIAEWVGDQVALGFDHVCQGLLSVDARLVAGFHATTTGIVEQSRILSNAIADLGTAMVSAIGRHEERLANGLDILHDDLKRTEERRAREHTRVALAYFERRLDDDAFAAAEQGIAAFSGYFPAHWLLANIAVVLGDAASAEASAKRALAQSATVDAELATPRRVLARMLLGRLAATRGAWDEAFRHLSAANTDDEGNLMAFIEVAHAWYRDESGGQPLTVRLKTIARNLDGLGEDAALGWYGMALLCSEDEPEEAVMFVRRGLRVAGPLPLDAQRFSRMLNLLYPSMVPFLYAAVLRYAPDLESLI